MHWPRSNCSNADFADGARALESAIEAGRLARRMKEETNVSYLAAFYYTGAVLLLLTGVFAGLSQSWGMAAGSFILGVVLLSYRSVVTRNSG
jgi:hypothetical protein